MDIVEDIYEKYYQYNLGDDIDHNREISNALELIESGEYDKKYDYILIDEYQDINFVRCKLLQEIQKSSGAKIFAVGDDWQSIYKFNGSDVSLFIDFDKYFPGSEIIKIEKEPIYISLGDINPISLKASKIESPVPEYTTTSDSFDSASDEVLDELDINTLTSYLFLILSIAIPVTIE